MPYSIGFALRAAIPAALLVLQPAVAASQAVEKPPSYSASQIRGIKRVGDNYTIRNTVSSNGILRVYVVTTPHGDMTVHGDEMLRMRLNELVALARLDKIHNSESFSRALAQAGLSPLKFTGQLIVNPVGTVENTFSGVGAMFGRIRSGIANAGKTPEGAMAGLLGVSSEKRELAAAYGVDPYTDLPALNAKLDHLSRAAALGGLVVTGALIAVPGAAGIVVSNLSTAHKLNNIGIDELARNYTAAQIFDLNRSRLAAMGVAPALSEQLLANRNYTPIDVAAMVAALDSMAAVQQREIFIERAVAADSRTIAYFTRRQAELLANAYRAHGAYLRFVALAGYPFAATRDGSVVTLVPIDSLSWTSETAAVFGAITAARKQIAPKARGELRITGQATALAKRQLKSQGWAVLENQRP